MPSASKKLPYGNSNFEDLITSGFAYVDKTKYIELLEKENNRFQFFIRPRRFGKTLFFSMLDRYYSLLKKEKFGEIFGNLYIGKNPSPEHNKYAVLKFNFSGLSTDSKEAFENSFSYSVQESCRHFSVMYEKFLKNSDALIKSMQTDKLGTTAVKSVINAAHESEIPVFVIIDEYDHFSNDIVAMGGKYYKETVGRKGIVRDFYENLKIATELCLKRIFITGISPIMLNDLTSGFNIATNYSLKEKYNEMLGFTSKEVKWLMQEIGVDAPLIKVDMEAYYNGYLFNKNAENKVYNPTMVLFLFDQILQNGRQPEVVIDENLHTDYERLKRLAENESNKEKLQEIINEGGVLSNVIDSFSIDKVEADEYFVSLLFYMGMLTIGEVREGTTYLQIPNYSVKTLYWEYIAQQLQNETNCNISTINLTKTIQDMAYRANIEPYLNFFTENFLKRLSNRDLIKFDEKYVKVMMLSSLFLSRLYLPKSEDESIEGYTDIYLQKHYAIKDIKYEWVLEIKYAKSEASEAEIEAKRKEALFQIERYKKDPRFASRDDVKFAVILFKGKEKWEMASS